MRSGNQNGIAIALFVFKGVLLAGHSCFLDRAIPEKGENGMITRDTIRGYFTCLKQKKGWEAFLSDDMVFTSFTSPLKQVTGKDAYLEATKRFYTSIISVEVKDLLVEGEKACALTHYELQPSKGNTFTCDVAEV